MNLTEFQNSLKQYTLPTLIESIVLHKQLRLVGRGIFVFLIVLLIPSFGIVSGYQTLATAVFILLIALLLIVLALDAVFYSYMSKDTELYTYEIALIALSTKNKDPIKTFLYSSLGKETIERAGIEYKLLQAFFETRKFIPTGNELRIEKGESKAKSYITALVKLDPQFSGFLSAHGVTSEVFWNAFEMTAGMSKLKIEQERWWSKAILGEVHPIGGQWAYGETYLLNRFSEKIKVGKGVHVELHSEEIKRLEAILEKEQGAHALIVGEEGIGKMEIVEGYERLLLSKKQNLGKDLRIIVLRTEKLAAYTTSAPLLEETLIKIFNEVEKAGNVILVIPEIAILIRTAESFHADFISMINPYLRSSSVRIVAIADTDDFHSHIEHISEFTTRFEQVKVKDASVEEVIFFLKDKAFVIERTVGAILSYPALEETVKLASRYFVDIPLSHASEDLLLDALSRIKGEGRRVLLREDVWKVAEARTGIETGNVDAAEKIKLGQLEVLLRERVVGQDEAISMVADSLRRARAGISDADRPLGSFLFFGPTGVGKTEMTKALAEVFFGGEQKILRLDMSEYNTSDSVERLLGTYAAEGSGVLSHMIKENPYGVLLLDEFEKTNDKVLDIFLQILDEGIFHDAAGRKISARNLIIVATSNAGSDIMYLMSEEGKDLVSKRSEIIDSIVSRGIFKPELLNRFDGIIFFSQLKEPELREIAKLLLKQLEWRLKEKGITLVPNDALLDFLVKKGADPKYGARPLQRAVQDTIQSVIAKGILSGKYTTGSRVELTPQDLMS